MPSGLAEKQNPENGYHVQTLLMPSFPLYMMWRPNSSVKHGVIFSPLIIAKDFFFLWTPFSHCKRKSLLSPAIAFTPFPVARAAADEMLRLSRGSHSISSKFG